MSTQVDPGDLFARCVTIAKSVMGPRGATIFEPARKLTLQEQNDIFEKAKELFAFLEPNKTPENQVPNPSRRNAFQYAGWVVYSDSTLEKVREALRSSYGCSKADCSGCDEDVAEQINAMQNAGIIFRERV